MPGGPFYEERSAACGPGGSRWISPITLGVVLTLVMSVVETALGANPRLFRRRDHAAVFLLIGGCSNRRCGGGPGPWPRTSRPCAARPRRGSRPTARCATCRSARSRPAPACWCARASGCRWTAGSSAGDRRSMRASSPARPCRWRSGRAPASRPAPSNGDGALVVAVTAAAGASFLDEVEALMRRALEARSRIMVLSDRATRLYVPLVHAAAALTGAGWLLAGPGAARRAAGRRRGARRHLPARSASRFPPSRSSPRARCFRDGVLLNDGSALERLGGSTPWCSTRPAR